jgi:hypothetical protein
LFLGKGICGFINLFYSFVTPTMSSDPSNSKDKGKEYKLQGHDVKIVVIWHRIVLWVNGDVSEEHAATICSVVVYMWKLRGGWA